MGRAIQSYLGYALEERIHLNTHRYDEPLVPLSRTRGVTERTDVQGDIVIPLRDDEVRHATRELVAAGAKAIVICLLQSHKNLTKTANQLGIAKSTLYEKIREYGLLGAVSDTRRRGGIDAGGKTLYMRLRATPSQCPENISAACTMSPSSFASLRAGSARAAPIAAKIVACENLTNHVEPPAEHQR